MSTDILLDDVTCPNATITQSDAAKKLVEHQYDRSDSNHVTEMGRGIRRLRVQGVCSTLAQRDTLEAKCEQAGEKYLYFSSISGAEQDRYYLVKTSALRTTPVSGTVYRYEFDALAADPIPYVTATAAHVWS